MADSSDPIIISPTLTYAGQAAAFNATNNGLELQLTHVTFGTRHYDPTGNEVGLLGPVGNKVAIAGGSRPTPTQIRMVTAWNENVGAVAIGEIGWWAGNVLVYVWSKADGTIASYKTDGAAYVLFNDLALAQVPDGSINIVVSGDESAALAALGAHEGDPDPHPQYLLREDFPNAQGLLVCEVSGIINALELTTSDEVSVTDYRKNQQFRFTAARANTDAVTVRVNGMPPMAITKNGTQPLASGDMLVGGIYDIIFDGVNFQIAGGVGGGTGNGTFFSTFEAVAVSGQVTFPATYSPGSEMVFVGGSKLAKDAYTATDGSNVTLKTAPVTGVKVVILAFTAFSVANTYSRAEFDTQVAALVSQIEDASESGVSLDGPDVIYPGSTNTYTITDYDKFSVLTITADVGTVTRSGATVTLVIAAGVTAKTSTLSVKRGTGKPRKVIIGIGASGISQPSITAPATDATGVMLSPTIVASNFAPYPAGADTQALAEWQVATDAAFTNIIWSSSSAVNLNQVTLPDGKLAITTKYYTRVRYKGATLAAYSEWSPVVTFTTTNQYIAQPSIISPAANAIGVKATPLVTSSAFSTFPANVNAHVSSSWRIKLAGVVVYELLKSTSSLLSLRVPKGILQVGKAYTVEVCHHGGTLPDSAWSAAVSFTTASYFEYGEYAAVAHQNTPYLLAYGVDIDTLIKMTFPDATVTNYIKAIKFSPDGQYLALGLYAAYDYGTAKLLIFKRTEDSFSLVHNEAFYEAPFGLAWSADSMTLAVAWLDNSVNGHSLRKRTGDTFAVVALPNSQAGNKYAIAISIDSLYVAVAIQITYSSVAIFKKAANGNYVLANYISPGNMCTQVAFSPDGKYLACGGTGFVKVYTVATLETTQEVVFSNPVYGSDVAFTADSKYLVIASTLSLMYKISDSGVFTKMTIPAINARYVALTSASDKVLFGLDGSPFISLYALANDTLNKLANPATMPTGTIGDVSLSPSVIGS